MNRRRFSAKALMARLQEFNGRCVDCDCKTGGSNGLEWDHIVPLAMHGQDEIDNLQPLCKVCHKAKTRTDKGHIAKAKRMDQRNAGIRRQPSRPLPGSKASGWKQKISGEWVRR